MVAGTDQRNTQSLEEAIAGVKDWNQELQTALEQMDTEKAQPREQQERPTWWRRLGERLRSMVAKTDQRNTQSLEEALAGVKERNRRLKKVVRESEKWRRDKEAKERKRLQALEKQYEEEKAKLQKQHERFMARMAAPRDPEKRRMAEEQARAQPTWWKRLGDWLRSMRPR
jgi:hypothetical protein